MKTTFTFLCCLLILHVQAGQDNTSSSCRCKNGFITKRISPRLLKSEPSIHHPSVFCPQTEIIITTVTGEKKCVNPESPLGKLLLKNKQKYDKKMAEGLTTSNQSTTSSSTSQRTTSRSLH